VTSENIESLQINASMLRLLEPGSGGWDWDWGERWLENGDWIIFWTKTIFFVSIGQLQEHYSLSCSCIVMLDCLIVGLSWAK